MNEMITRTYNADGSPPTTIHVPLHTRNFVTPVAPVDATLMRQVADAALQPTQPVELDGPALASMRTVSEMSTPVQRGLGVAIKGAYIIVITSLATYALTLTGATGAQVAWFFVVLSLAGVALLIWLDYSNSPIGGERFKAWLYFRLQRQRVQSEERVQLAKVAAFREMIGVVYGAKSIGPDEG